MEDPKYIKSEQDKTRTKKPIMSSPRVMIASSKLRRFLKTVKKISHKKPDDGRLKMPHELFPPRN